MCLVTRPAMKMEKLEGWMKQRSLKIFKKPGKVFGVIYRAEIRKEGL